MDDMTEKRSMTPTRLQGGFGAGVGAALAMMVVMAVLRLTTNTISIPELMENSLVTLAGGQLELQIINAVGVGGKALLLVSIVEGTLLLGGLLGWLFARFWPFRAFENQPKWVQGVLYGLLLGLFLNIVFLPLVDQGFFGSRVEMVTAPPDIAQAIYGSNLAPFGVPVFLDMFILSLAFGLTLVGLLPWKSIVPARAEGEMAMVPADGPAEPGRRDFMKVLGGGAVAVLGGGALWVIIRQALQAPPVAAVEEVDVSGSTGTPTPMPEGTSVAGGQATPAPSNSFADVKARLVPEVTPVENFYITTKNIIDPTVDGGSWSLTFKGLVDNPYTVTLEDVMALPSQERTETLACISNSVGGSLISNGKWKGVDFAEMLKKAGPKANATEVVMTAADGYTDSIPLEVALNNGCMLAYEMNGAALVTKHGYPTRLLVPNIYGMKNVKWITEVELTSSDFRGYWELQGWSDTAEYQTMSRIDYPDIRLPSGPVYIGGVAFAGSRGIQRVEVSTDGGQTWGDANLRASLGKDAWTQWTYPWIATSGEHKLVVRATDGTGQVQTSNSQDTYPDGATGWHTKSVLVG